MKNNKGYVIKVKGNPSFISLFLHLLAREFGAETKLKSLIEAKE